MRVSTLTAAAALAALAASPVQAAFTGDISNLGTPATDLADLPTPVDSGGSVGFQNTSDPNNGFRSPYDGVPGVNSNGASYTAIGSDNDNSFATYNFSGSFLDILWGSPDDTGGNGAGFANDASRQWIEFYSEPNAEGSVIDTVTAADLKASGLFPDAEFSSDLSGNNSFAWARFTNIGGGQSFESIKLVHTAPAAFEVDGVVTPLPGAAVLMLTGLAGVGAYVRRSRKAEAAA